MTIAKTRSASSAKRRWGAFVFVVTKRPYALRHLVCVWHEFYAEHTNLVIDPKESILALHRGALRRGPAKRVPTGHCSHKGHHEVFQGHDGRPYSCNASLCKVDWRERAHLYQWDTIDVLRHQAPMRRRC